MARDTEGDAWITTQDPKPFHEEYFESPDDWRQELIYFLLPDRFNDAGYKTAAKGALDRRKPVAHVPPSDGPLKTWRWDYWALSGRSRFQGGTINGITDQLPYLEDLGITALWIGPVWKQRVVGIDENYSRTESDDHFSQPDKAEFRRGRFLDYSPEFLPRDDYHGYAVQDFLTIDPRFGTTDDLCVLVQQAHAHSIRVVLDIQINHSGENWSYQTPPILSPLRPPYDLPGGQYEFGAWLDDHNHPITHGSFRPDDAVWPAVLRNPDYYSRMGKGNYSSGTFGDDNAEFRVADSFNRDFNYSLQDPTNDPVLQSMTKIWTYWIAKTDCDGFRVDTFKHVPPSTAQAFCRQVRAFAAALPTPEGRGKHDFLIAGEVGGTDMQAATYLALDPGVRIFELDSRRRNLRHLAGGDLGVAPRLILQPDKASLDDIAAATAEESSQLASITDDDVRDRVLTSVDDHDGLGLWDGNFGRLAAVHTPDSVVPAAALLLYGPGIPVWYYGTEQALSGPQGNGNYLDNYGLKVSSQGRDRYLREAMFGPTHPRPAGASGHDRLAARDLALPGFGPFGTCGKHVFDQRTPWFRAVALLARLRKDHPVLAVGDIDLITSCDPVGGPAGSALPPGVVAWTRRLNAPLSAGGSVGAAVITGLPGNNPTPALNIELTGWPSGRQLAATAVVDGATGAVQNQASGTVMQWDNAARVYHLDVGIVTAGQVRVYVW